MEFAASLLHIRHTGKRTELGVRISSLSWSCIKIQLIALIYYKADITISSKVTCYRHYIAEGILMYLSLNNKYSYNCKDENKINIMRKWNYTHQKSILITYISSKVVMSEGWKVLILHPYILWYIKGTSSGTFKKNVWLDKRWFLTS